MKAIGSLRKTIRVDNGMEKQEDEEVERLKVIIVASQKGEGHMGGSQQHDKEKAKVSDSSNEKEEPRWMQVLNRLDTIEEINRTECGTRFHGGYL